MPKPRSFGELRPGARFLQTRPEREPQLIKYKVLKQVDRDSESSKPLTPYLGVPTNSSASSSIYLRKASIAGKEGWNAIGWDWKCDEKNVR